MVYATGKNLVGDKLSKLNEHPELSRLTQYRRSEISVKKIFSNLGLSEIRVVQAAKISDEHSGTELRVDSGW